MLKFSSPPLSRLPSRASRASTFHDIPKWRACSLATINPGVYTALKSAVKKNKQNEKAKLVLLLVFILR